MLKKVDCERLMKYLRRRQTNWLVEKHFKQIVRSTRKSKREWKVKVKMKKSSNQDLLLLHFMDNNFFSVLWIVFIWSLFTIENKWWWTLDIYLEENRKAISWPSRTLRTILLKPQKIFFMKALLRNIVFRGDCSWSFYPPPPLVRKY